MKTLERLTNVPYAALQLSAVACENRQPASGIFGKGVISGRLPAKAAGEEIKFGGVAAARRRLDVLDAGEIALELGEKRGLGAALQHLADKASAGREHFAREMRSRFRQRHDAQMVGLPMAGGIGRHVGEHDIGFAAKNRL